MADEELAPEGGEALELAPEVQEEAPQTDPAIEALAREMRWTPKDEWHGDPEKWKPADQFIRDGAGIQQTTSRELRSLREQMERIGGVTETIVRDKVAEAQAEWQRLHDQAVEDGDKEAARALLKQQPAPPTNGKTPDPHVTEWVGKNAWYNTDPLAQARAAEISDRLAHLPVPEQLKQVERAIRKEFPEHFPKAKDPPATQTGQSRNPNPSNRVKGFADMPLASQQVALDYEKRLGVPKEQTAKSYWQDQERVSR